MIKTKSKKVKLEKGRNIPKEAIDKYFVANTAEIFVPDKVVNVDNKGKIKLVDTLTKTKSIKKIKGKPVIKIEDKNINGIVINQEGEKLMDKSRGLLYALQQKQEAKLSNARRQEYDKKIADIRNKGIEKLKKLQAKESEQKFLKKIKAKVKKEAKTMLNSNYTKEELKDNREREEIYKKASESIGTFKNDFGPTKKKKINYQI
jgi:hypothetical protein